jgi:hypothetical protein
MNNTDNEDRITRIYLKIFITFLLLAFALMILKVGKIF